MNLTYISLLPIGYLKNILSNLPYIAIFEMAGHQVAEDLETDLIRAYLNLETIDANIFR